jgi:cytochrome c oxidase assembly protein subunit 15
VSEKPNPTRPIALWLLLCCGMIFVMALLGAITRLTESGLSITDWNPVMGFLPPLSESNWNKAFAGYQHIPQYQLLHHGMTLDEFKSIYFWEWLHRLWGQLIGLAFALPFVWFLVRREIGSKLGWRLAILLALGALQGFIGWFMVQSGLEVRTSVSPYRLALHLGFALAIYAVMLWTALDLLQKPPPHLRKLRTCQGASPSFRFLPLKGGGTPLVCHGWVALGLLAVTMVWGAFTAGLHAGEAYNTWPLMEGEMLPSAAFTILPKWYNVFENLALVQFIHRWLGPATMFVILAWVIRCVRWNSGSRWIYALGIMSILQVALGLATLLTHANIVLATLHQAGAITLLSLLLVNLWRFKRLR